jgi:hypothetical protein
MAAETDESAWDAIPASLMGIAKDDPLVPDSFLDRLKQTPYHGERRVLASILIDALEVIFKDSKHDRRRREEAVQWVLSEDEDEWVFSFNSVCDSLDLVPSAVRRRLKDQIEHATPENQSKRLSRL